MTGTRFAPASVQRALLVLLLLEALALAFMRIPTASVTEAGFGFGPYVEGMMGGHGYSAVGDCGQREWATRMPLVPWLLFAVGALGGSLRSASVLKSLVLVGVFALTLSRFQRWFGDDTRSRQTWAAILASWAAMPAVAKHLSEVSYEEGCAILLVPTLLLCLVALWAAPAHRRLDGWLVTTGALLTALYLLKSSYLPFIFIGFCLLCGRVFSIERGAGALQRGAGALQRSAGALAVTLALLGPALWIAHTHGKTGQARLGTSFDGANLYRGMNRQALLVYPEHSLDVLFTGTSDLLQALGIRRAPDRCSFRDEWAYDAHLREEASRFVWDAPGEAARLALRKLWVVAFEVRPVPHQPADRRTAFVLNSASFVIGRAMLVVLTLLLLRKLRCRASERRPVRDPTGLAVVLLAAGLVVPLLLGFAYDRHTLVLLVSLMTLLGAVHSALGARTSAAGPGPASPV